MATRGARARVFLNACASVIWAVERVWGLFFLEIQSRQQSSPDQTCLSARPVVLGPLPKKNVGVKKNILESVRGKIQPNCRETFNRTDKENSFCSLQQPLDIQRQLKDLKKRTSQSDKYKERVGKEEKSETLFIDKVRNNCEEAALKWIAADAPASWGDQRKLFKAVVNRAQTAGLVEQFIPLHVNSLMKITGWKRKFCWHRTALNVYCSLMVCNSK